MSPDAWMAAPAEAEADAPADSDAPAEAAADSDGAVEAPAEALAPAWLLFEPQAAVNSASAESRARPLTRVVGMRSSSGGGPGGSPRCSSGSPIPGPAAHSPGAGNGVPTLPRGAVRTRCERDGTPFG